jgi:hypothetical protein
MLKPTKVQAPEGCESFLTAGKIYDVVSCDPSSPEEDGYGFTIISDLGNEIYCLGRYCAHLKGKNWIIVDVKKKPTKVKYIHPIHSPNLTVGKIYDVVHCDSYQQHLGAFIFEVMNDNGFKIVGMTGIAWIIVETE